MVSVSVNELSGVAAKERRLLEARFVTEDAKVLLLGGVFPRPRGGRSHVG